MTLKKIRSHPKTSFIWSGWLENSSFSAQAAGVPHEGMGDAEHWKGYSQDSTRYVRGFGMISRQKHEDYKNTLEQLNQALNENFSEETAQLIKNDS